MSKRVGVFVCECGTNIASVVDTARVAEEASKFPELHLQPLINICALIPGRN